MINILGRIVYSTLSAALLIIQLTSSGGIICHELQSSWFRVGVALPFYYGVKGFRTIFFGAGEGRMWLNWVVLTGWNVGCLPVALIFGAMKVRQRVHKALLPSIQEGAAGQSKGDERDLHQSTTGKADETKPDEENGLSDLGDVALMGA